MGCGYPPSWKMTCPAVPFGPGSKSTAKWFMLSPANGTQARLRSRSLRVAVADDLLAALRELLGAERVQLVKAT